MGNHIRGKNPIFFFIKKIVWEIKRFVLKSCMSDLEYNNYGYTYRFNSFTKRNYHKASIFPILEKKQIIFITDREAIVGGLCDRLRGCISAFCLSKELGIDFKIHWTEPFSLEEYLVPNMYDWKMNTLPNMCIPFAVPICVASKYGTADTPEPVRQREMIYQKNKMCKAVSRNPHSHEYHIYSNAYFGDSRFAEYFKELFKPSPKIQELIDQYSIVGTSYISISFRFLELLGDFKEQYGGKTLSEEDKLVYLNDSIMLIRRLFDENKNTVSRVLVASDSETLLEEAKKLDFVFVIPGRIKHTALPNNNFDKEFVDFFMISKAEHVYLAKKGDMWMSTFPYYASLVGNKPFSLITF